MKRGGSLPRRTPLRAKTPLVGTTPLARSARLTRTAMARKRPQRTSEEARARQLVRARSGGVCEMDGRAAATDVHHRRNRSQGGGWSADNLLHLCHEHHMAVTVNPAVARQRGWSVSAYANPATTPVWLAGRGWSYLRADGAITPANRSAAA